MPRAVPLRPTASVRTLLLAVLTVPGLTTGFGAVAAQELTVAEIITSDDFVAEGLPSFRWTPDGSRMTWVQPDPSGEGDALVAFDPASGSTETLVSASELVPGGERRPIAIEGYEWGPEERRLLLYTRSVRVWRDNTKGVYFVFDLDTRRLQPISTGFGYQMFAKLSPDGSRVGFVRDHDLWVSDLATGEERRLTDDGSETIINGTFDWVYEEELGLQDGWRWSPDGTRIAYWRLDAAPIQTFWLIDQMDLYSEPVPIPYPKAGKPNSFARIGVLELATGETTWMDTGDNPDVYLARMEWAASSDEVLIQRLNRRQNRLDLLLADAETGTSRLLFTEESETYVPVRNDLTWLDGGQRFVWSSERDGYRHLYLYRRDGSLERQLTAGPWEITSVDRVDAANGRVYFTAARPDPLQRRIYRVALAGGEPAPLAESEGTWSQDVAPGGRWVLSTHHGTRQPPVIALRESDGSPVRTLVDNAALRDRLADLPEREFFTFETAGGVELNGYMIRPPDFDPSREYPVVMYVYGGPGSQTVQKNWSPYGRGRHQFHQLLAQRGFIVASVDNRGTGARGRDFRTLTYLELGRIETEDQVAAGRYLASLEYVDADRIGIWGWSYGGFMTLLALQQGADVFAGGISVAPVSSWRFYDTIYTERYMRTPAENPDGYDDNSPLSYPERLEDPLFLVHGTGDDNVHVQNTIRMVQRFQDAGKSFDLMLYPNKTHSIDGTETRIHLYSMMLDWWIEELMGDR